MLRALILIVALGAPLQAEQNLHSNFKDPTKLTQFQRISKRLLCQCGCKMPLHTCTHTHCTAWTMRAAIEGLIDEGKSDQFIIDGFRNGFGEMTKTHAAFARGRTDLGDLTAFARGFGDTALSEPEHSNPGVYILLVAIALLGTIIFFIKARMGRVRATPPETPADEELYKKLYD